MRSAQSRSRRARPLAARARGAGSRAALAASLLAALATAPDARAEPYVILAPGAVLAAPDDVAIGPGGSATFGWGLDLEPLLLAPELSLAGHALLGEATQSLLRATAGVRVGVTASVEPSAFVRAGAGLTDAGGAGPADPSASGGVAIDAGAALDVRLSRDVTVGGQLGYAGLVDVGGQTGGVHGLDAAARLGLWF